MAMRKNDPRKKKQFPHIGLDDEIYKCTLSSVSEPALVSSTLEPVCNVDLCSYEEAPTGKMIDLAQRQFPRIDLEDKRYKGALSSVPEPAIVSSTSTLERVCDVDLSSYVEVTTSEMIDPAQR
ncbi:DUF1279 superfamily, partial [Pestalotiopsis sp. IQ-011]